MNKLWFALILIFLVVIGIFIFYFLNNHKMKPLNLVKIKPTPTVIVTPEIPKVTTYEVPILMYHYIRIADPTDKLGVALSVTPDNFNKQMKWLSEHDFVSIHLADFADPKKQTISRIISQKKKPVVITFDDGYDNAYTEAMPILKKYGFSGTVFVIRDFVGRAEYMTQAQIDAMTANGMEIGSHTLSHIDLSKWPSLVSKKQIFDSKLDAQTFCYPSGKFTAETVQFVKDAGYVAAVTTKGGIAHQDSNLFELPRLRIENISIENFAKKLTLNN